MPVGSIVFVPWVKITYRIGRLCGDCHLHWTGSVVRWQSVRPLTLGGWGFNRGPGVVGSLHQPDFHTDCGTAILDWKDGSSNPEYPSVEGLVKTMKPTFLPAGQKPAISVSMCAESKVQRSAVFELHLVFCGLVKVKDVNVISL